MLTSVLKGSPTGDVCPGRPRLLRDRKARAGLLFVTPAILFFGAFYLYPLGFSLWISFHEWSLLSEPTFVGFANYRRLGNDAGFWSSVWVTLYFVVGTVAPMLVLSLALAVVFNRPFKFHRTFLVSYYIPAVIALTVWSLVWLLMYHPSFGLLTLVTGPLGFGNVRWLNDPNLAMPALILLSIIKGGPTYMIIYLAGLRNIPRDYYEAAAVDGANGWQQFRYITLPRLRPVMLFVTVWAVIIAFQVFVPSFLMTGGGPGSATRVLPLFVYENAFQFLRMGYASAASLVLFVVLLAATVLLFRMFPSDTDK